MLQIRHMITTWRYAGPAADAETPCGAFRPGSGPVQADADESRGAAGHPLRVAVAEDEQELRDYFVRVLPHLGYDLVAVTASGEDLVRACSEKRPHVVISDVQLQRMTGPEAVALIRQQSWVAAIYVVESSLEQLIAVKAARSVVLAKPFRMSELNPAIEQAIEIPPDDSCVRNPMRPDYL